ncbi:MAG: hypothetical protein ACRDPC_14780, partial [Solirubrobacteraceae bacterium]
MSAARIVVIAVLAQAVLVALFVLPGYDPEPHDVPLAVAGPAAQQVQQRADAERPGAIEVVPVADAAGAREAVLDREAYGALLPQEGTLLVATAASPPVAQLLQGAFPDTAVEELKPLDPEDPRGVSLNLMMLPLIVTALPVALLLARLPLSGVRLAGVTLAFSALGGFAVTGVVAGLIGALPGSYPALAGVAALLVAAVTMLATGIARPLGEAGVGLAAVVVFLVGNPASGAASAPELLPDFWRQLGPLLPPGAGATALRNVAYFDG